MMPMRRSDRAVTEMTDILQMLDRCAVCRLGLVDAAEAYIVPMNFGYTYEDERLTLYFHGARVGRKIDLITRNPRASFELDGAHELIRSTSACQYSYAFESVMGSGAIRVLETADEKAAGLNAIMAHFTSEPVQYDAQVLTRTAVIQLTVDQISAKRKTPPEEGGGRG